MDDLSKDFRPISISGSLTIVGEDGRTCEVEIHEIALDRQRIEGPIDFGVEHTAEYASDGVFRHIVGNPITALSAKIHVAPNAQENLFTATFRPAES